MVGLEQGKVRWGGVDKESMGVEEGGRVVHLGQVRS